MKKEVFNQYVDKIVELFKISRSELFEKTKRSDIVDARYLLYYLCSRRQIRVMHIKNYMGESGYKTQHTTIIRGISNVESKMKEDSDYVTVVKDLEKSVFI